MDIRRHQYKWLIIKPFLRFFLTKIGNGFKNGDALTTYINIIQSLKYRKKYAG